MSNESDCSATMTAWKASSWSLVHDHGWFLRSSRYQFWGQVWQESTIVVHKAEEGSQLSNISRNGCLLNCFHLIFSRMKSLAVYDVAHLRLHFDLSPAASSSAKPGPHSLCVALWLPKWPDKLTHLHNLVTNSPYISGRWLGPKIPQRVIDWSDTVPSGC